jgi:hypothetical protein
MADLGLGSGYIAEGGDIKSRVAKTLAWKYEACKGKSPLSDFPLATTRYSMAFDEQ